MLPCQSLLRQDSKDMQGDINQVSTSNTHVLNEMIVCIPSSITINTLEAERKIRDIIQNRLQMWI